MFVLHELSSGDDASKNKSNEIITSLDNKNVVDISDDDVTVVLCQTDNDQSTPKKCSEEEKEEIPASYKQDGTRTSCISLRSNESVSKGNSNLTKQLNEESEKVLRDKPLVEINKNSPFGKTENATYREDVNFEFQNSSEAKVVPRGRKVFTPNVKPKTTRYLMKQSLSASPSLPETTITEASLFSSLPEKKQSNAAEKSDEESIVEKRGRQSSTSKQSKEQSELDGELEKELEKGPFKFEKYKEMIDKMGSAVILLHRLSPPIIAKSHVADQRKLSLSEKNEAPSSVTSLVSDEAKVPSEPNGDEMAEVELIASPKEVDRKSKKSLIRRKKEVGSADVNRASEKKRPRVSEEEEDRISSASFDSGVSVFLKDRSAVTIVNQQVKNSSKGSSSSSNEEREHESSSKVNLPTARPHRGRQSKSVSSVSTNINVSKEDPILPADEKDKVFDPKSKETLPCLADSESSNESEEKEEASVSGNKLVEEILERETIDQDVEFLLQEGYSLRENSPKRGRGRPLKNVASKFGIASVPLPNENEIDVGTKSTKLSTRRMVIKRAVESKKSDATPQKRKCFSGETAMSPVKSDNEDFGGYEDINNIQKKVFVPVVRRGRGRPSKTATSMEKTIQKYSVDQVADRSTKETTLVTPETRVKYCNVLLERNPEIDALCIKMKNRQEKKSIVKVDAAKPWNEIPAKSTSKVTRGINKLVNKSEPDKVATFSPRRKLRVRQM